MASLDGHLPPHLLNLEGLNCVLAALIIVGTQQFGSEYGREVLALADQLMAERT